MYILVNNQRHVSAKFMAQPDDGHELAEICRWLYIEYTFFIPSSCVIDYL